MSNKWNSLTNNQEKIIALNAKIVSLNNIKHVNKKEDMDENSSLRKSATITKGTMIQRTSSLDNRHGKFKDPCLMNQPLKQ
jgi:hypothetical protein